jgi:hypothetical protein
MTTSTRTRTVLARAGLVLATTGALVFSPACNDASPVQGGDQEQEEQDDNGGNEQDD